jgi:triosephosphate isomerase
MRRPLVAGNWKMNTDRATAGALARDLAQRSGGFSAAVDVLVCPPSVWISGVADILLGTSIRVGGQNLHYEDDGAFTGEISATMLKSAGCSHVIIGHSERRQFFGETDATVNARIKKAQQHGLAPVVCVGETLTERESGNAINVVRRQVLGALRGVPEGHMSTLVLAYEPVWAIGTGINATPEQAQEMHAYIRGCVTELYSPALAASVPILYGGSVKPDNATAIFENPDVDGGLIGGASLKGASFQGIIEAAA